MRFLYLVSILSVVTLAAHPEDKKPESKPSSSIRGAALGISQKLERIEDSLGKVAKSPLAPAGIKTVLHDVQLADDQVKKAQSEGAAKAIFQNISAEIAAFQEQLAQKKKQLLEADKADRANVSKSFGSIAKKLQSREAQIEANEHKAQEAHKKRQELSAAHAKTVAKMKHSKLTKEDQHTDKLLKYLDKKQERKFHKKMAQWKEEKQALHDAIEGAQAGNTKKLLTGMKQLTHIEKGDQDFLH